MLLSLQCAAALGAFVASPAPAGRACPGPRCVSPSMREVVWTPSIRGPEGEPTPRDLAFGPLGSYCDSLEQVVRRKTRTVEAGPVRFGSEHPIVRQTMATTLTSDVDATVEQVPSAVVGGACVRAWGAGGQAQGWVRGRAASLSLAPLPISVYACWGRGSKRTGAPPQVVKCADEGFDLVRVTVVGMRDAKACMQIREKLDARGYSIPLCADMHFQPKVALAVADAVEKIRINPGNFADGRKSFEEMIYETDEQFFADRDYFVEVFAPLVEKCKELNRAMRIGTNHGSLSARILSFYGDTPRGMVESALEFADICRSLDYHNFVFSMKASNPLVMVQAYRLLAAEQYRLGWDYPLHLGVTEAGEGEDGRMKSAIGIGALLADGLGDTIRVSLTEDPEYEYAPCNRLAEIGGARLEEDGLGGRAAQAAVPTFTDTRDFTSFAKRIGRLPAQAEGDDLDYRSLLHRDGSVMMAVTAEDLRGPMPLYKGLGCKTVVGLPFKDVATVDSLLLREPPAADDAEARQTIKRMQDVAIHFIVPADALAANPIDGAVPLMSLDAAAAATPTPPRQVISLKGDETPEQIEQLKTLAHDFLLLDVPDSLSRLHASRRLFGILDELEIDSAVIHHFKPEATDTAELALQIGAQVGGLLCDGLGDGVLVEPTDVKAFTTEQVRTSSFGLLQGSRMRNIKTEFVSCPSCGRTLFDLQEVTAQISERTGHLPGVSIAIMGCIVNGPGEMADADFGYVGGAPGKVDLYVGKEVVKRAIPNDDACDALVDLIKEHGARTPPPLAVP